MVIRGRFIWAPVVVLVLAAVLTQLPLAAFPIDPDDREALARAYRALTGHDIDPRYVCGRAVPGFSDVVALGEFAHDRGCAAEGVAVAGKPLDLARGTQAGLARAGWATAAPAERRRLALAWTRGVLLAFRTIADEAPEAFTRPGAPAFAAPTAVPLPDGGVRVELWVHRASMLPQSEFARLAFTFAPSGATGEAEQIGEYVAPMRR
jgi:hypothetical protein